MIQDLPMAWILICAYEYGWLRDQKPKLNQLSKSAYILHDEIPK